MSVNYIISLLLGFSAVSILMSVPTYFDYKNRKDKENKGFQAI